MIYLYLVIALALLVGGGFAYSYWQRKKAIIAADAKKLIDSATKHV